MKTFVIGEIGINHNGDMNIVREMIKEAKLAGCDAVKFQKRTIDDVYSADYLAEHRDSPWGTTQREQKEGLELDYDEYCEIDKICKENDIDWFASAWDINSQIFLKQFNCKYNKVASALLTNKVLLNMIADEGKKTFISTGMSTLDEIDEAVEIFKSKNCPFELMHCNSTYPMEENDANLNVMNLLKERYACDIGYSGHEKGYFVSVCAAAHGATSIERHITLDKTMYGSDQKASIDMNELKEMVQYIRRWENISGTGEKELSEGEMAVRKKLRG